MYFVYELVDPQTDTVFYVGITNNVSERLKQHLSCQGKNDKKHDRIQKLYQREITPSLKVLETVENKQKAIEREEYWIYYYLDQNVELANLQLYPQMHKKRHGNSLSSEKQNSKKRYSVSEKYYMAREAQQKLGVDENDFYYMIRTGKIKKMVPPGKKQGVYPKSQIDKLAKEMLHLK